MPTPRHIVSCPTDERGTTVPVTTIYPVKMALLGLWGEIVLART